MRWQRWLAPAGLLVCAIVAAPCASAQPNPGGGDIDINADIGLPGGGTVLILCPGVGTGANVLGAGGGWCDYDFHAGMHIHCEWGGFTPVAGGWNCWRVFRGQPDHPQLPDPDIVPDGQPPRPDALRGPTPADQAPLPPPDLPRAGGGSG